MTQNNELWKLTALEVEDGGQRVYRIRQTLPDGLKKDDFAEMVLIEWRFGDDGLPDKSTGANMQAFEAHLDPLDDHATNSVLVHVYTGAGIREWCYYAKSYDQFIADINRVLAGKPRFPIQILHDHDAIWKYQAGIKKASEGNG